jgi:AcrR family transcriptional regulator
MLLREEILDAARELFLKHGYENTSMRKIASKIEYSPTTIYIYFKDKAEILQTLCDETFGRLSHSLLEIERSDMDPVAKLRKVGLAYFDFALAHPNHYKLSFMTRFEGFQKSPEDFANSTGAKTFQCLVNCVKSCVESGAFRPIDVMAASQALWCAVHGVASLLIINGIFPFVEQQQLISTLMDTMLDGFRPRKI